MLNILQGRLQQYMNHELPDVQTGFRKGRRTRDQMPTSAGSQKKQESSRKASISALLPRGRFRMSIFENTIASFLRDPASTPIKELCGCQLTPPDYLARWLDQSLCLLNVPFGTVGMISQWKIQCLHSWEPRGKMWSCLWISVQFSHSVVSDSLRPHGLQHSRPPCPSPTPRAYSNACLSGQ